MDLNKIVVKFIKGTIIKGRTNDFFPHKNRFHIEQLNGEIVEINVEQLKAIFFVKDHEGDKHYIKNYNTSVPGGGRLIKVTFYDGESIIGYTQGYSPDRQGFFMVPADPDDNNDRIFVVRSSAVSIEFQTGSIVEKQLTDNEMSLSVLKE